MDTMLNILKEAGVPTRLKTGKTMFEMHGLVQLSMRNWLNLKGMGDKWKEGFVAIVADEFPWGDYRNWAACCTTRPKDGYRC